MTNKTKWTPGPKRIPDHAHSYGPHPTWSTHVACVICGLAIPAAHLAYALEHGASLAKAEGR